MVSGETHFVEGRRCRLKVVFHDGAAKVEWHKGRGLVLSVRRELSSEQRLRVLERWYRAKLRAQIADLVGRWSRKLALQPPEYGIKKMKTRLGSCSPPNRKIWINLELAKKPVQCLEFIVVHELIHLIERRHNARFVGIMDQALPDWRHRRDILNKAPLTDDHEKGRELCSSNR